MPGDLNQWGKKELARQILIYLTDHPDATDTLDGIVHWWLLERKIRYQMDLVREVLDTLVQEGHLVQDCGPDKKNRYHINSRTKENQQPNNMTITKATGADLESS